MAEQKFAIRLSAEGMEQVRSALRGMGADGEKALRQLDNGAAKASPSLRALDVAAKDARAEFDRFADSVPFVGGALKALGPAGIAAAGGLGLIVTAALAVYDGVQKAREEIDKIGTSAANIGTSAETFQALRAEAARVDIDVTKLQEGMSKLQLNTALATKGQGELFSTLKRVKPELADLLVAAGSNAERWDVLNKAIRETPNQLDRITIAKAAFGEQGAQFLRMLGDESKSVDGLTESARDAGVVIGEDLVAAVKAADAQLQQMQARTQTQEMKALIAWLPMLMEIEGRKSNFMTLVADVGNQISGADRQSLDLLRASYKEKMATIDLYEKQITDRIARGDDEAALAGSRMLQAKRRRDAEAIFNAIAIAELDRELSRSKASPAAEAGGVIEDPAAIAERERLKSEAARKAAEALREQAAVEKAAISIRQQAGDWTGVFAQKTAELNAVVGQYGVTQEMVNGILAKMRDELDGTAEAQQRFAALMESQKSAIDKIHERMAQFRQDEREGKISTEQMRDAIAALNTELAAAVAVTQPAADAVKNLGDAHAEARNSSFEFGLAVETTDAILRGQMQTFKDWEDVALNALYNVAMGALDTQSKIGGSSLGDYAGAILGAFGFGKSAAPSASATAGLVADVRHAGGLPGAPGPVRMVPLAAAQGAPRHHTGWDGLGSDEHLAVLQRGEPVVSRFDANRIVRALDGGGKAGGDVNITVINEGGGAVETREMRSADGGRDIELRIRAASAKGAAEGDLDAVMQQRYNIRRGVR